MEIAIVSDTHLPRGTRRLPESCLARLRAADLIIHAGDFVKLALLRELESLREVVGVHGNVDDEEVRAALPRVRVLEVQGVRIGLIHDGGPAAGRLARLRAKFPHTDAVVFGHSHIPLHEQSPDGFQIFNPGSPTERRRSPELTMGIANLHRLPRSDFRGPESAAQARAEKLGFELISLG